MSQTVVVVQHQNATSDIAADNADDAINEAGLIVAAGLGCCTNLLYCQYPECVGCSGKSECCCCVQHVCCKLGTEPLLCRGETDDGGVCLCGFYCCGLGCLKPRTCLAIQEQVCCIVTQLALPPTDEMPFVFACCFLTCHPECGCCTTLGELTTTHTAASTSVTVVQIAPAVTARAIDKVVEVDGPHQYKPACTFTEDEKAVLFTVDAHNDAHLALGEATGHDSPHYEIAIGAWGNSKSVLRHANQSPSGGNAHYDGRVLQPGQDAPFWVSWSNGMLRFGQGHVLGQQLLMEAPLNAGLPSPHCVRHMLVGSWNNHQRWVIKGKG